VRRSRSRIWSSDSHDAKRTRLKQTEVPGISERQLRRIEQSGAVSVRTLKQLAEAHHVSLEDYIDAVASKIPLSARRNSKLASPRKPASHQLP
jgi:hypothetical protein